LHAALVRDPAGNSEDHLGILERNEFQPLAAAELVARLSILVGLPELVVTVFLFQGGVTVTSGVTLRGCSDWMRGARACQSSINCKIMSPRPTPPAALCARAWAATSVSMSTAPIATTLNLDWRRRILMAGLSHATMMA
jgi:hypothetical protein